MQAFRIERCLARPRLVEVAVPEPGPGQVRIRVAGCGLCHSDLTMAQMPVEMADALGWQVPFTLGHETAGWVDAVGPGVGDGSPRGHRWRPGDAVAVASPASCGRCRWCRRGQENACRSGAVGRGYGADGGLAEYVLVDDPDRALVPLGALAPERAGPLTDAGATSYHAVRRVLPHLDGGSSVVVIGVGGLGGFAVQILAALSDARIVAVDVDRARLDRARALGAHLGVEGVDEATRASVAEALGSDPVDGVIDLVGTDATLGFGADVLAPGGAWAVVGAGGGTLRRPWFGGLPRDAEVFTFQGSDLADLRDVVQLAADGRVTVHVETFALDDADDAYERLARGALQGRAVVCP